MPDYRRNRVPGGIYFLTVVVHERYPLFQDATARRKLRRAIAEVRTERPFTLFAICLLPDHLHTVWVLPRDDFDFSTRVKMIKDRFTQSWLADGGWEGTISASRRRKGERGVWQRRFWEHTVRDESDLKHCVDYTHWNPCKHRLVGRVRDWPHSTFHQFVRRGEYDLDWGKADPCGDWPAAEFAPE